MPNQLLSALNQQPKTTQPEVLGVNDVAQNIPALPSPQVTQPTTQQAPTMDWGRFRSFVIQKMPNINQDQLKYLDNFVSQRQRAELVKAGVLDVGELAKTDPGSALQLANKGFSVADKVSGDKQLLAKAGLDNLSVAEDLFNKDPSLIYKQAIPGKLFSRQFDSALFSAVNSLLRAQTGAVAPEHEIKAYMQAYGPVLGDSPQDVAFKFERLKNILNQYLPSNMPENVQNQTGSQDNDPLGIR